ncbi:twin-arginine translocation pathway signal protein [Lentzea rhizosphaerae]|uniref:Twin-arginine translocation pathway signal protein n=1 Tax=Lentzea rhizosphaerae TaxID=2041025 RepID=A0ABV8BX33_9PSEU
MSGVALAVGSTGVAAAEPADCLDCVVRPEMTEGPYHVDDRLNRSDIRQDTSNGVMSEGTVFALAPRVLQVADGRCTPLKDAVVDIWHCDAAGLYSDVPREGTDGRNFLRGYQVSDRTGWARFTTVLPGWYRGRTVHIHKAGYLAVAPYAAKGAPDTTNAQDGIYSADGVGDQMLLRPARRGRGYAATFTVGLDLSDTEVGGDDGMTGPGGPGGPPPVA